MSEKQKEKVRNRELSEKGRRNYYSTMAEISPVLSVGALRVIARFIKVKTHAVLLSQLLLSQLLRELLILHPRSL